MYDIKQWEHIFKLDPAKQSQMRIWNHYVCQILTQSLSEGLTMLQRIM